MKGATSLLRRLGKLQNAVENDIPNFVTNTCEDRARGAQLEYANGGDVTGDKQKGPVDVTSTRQGDTWSIVASGEVLLFLEYGTGIVYPRTNPDDPYGAGSWSIEHEQYLTDSDKLAKYKGGWPLGNGQISYGNKSYNTMYNTRKTLEETLPRGIENILARANK